MLNSSISNLYNSKKADVYHIGHHDSPTQRHLWPHRNTVNHDSTPQMRQSERYSPSAQETLRLGSFGDVPFRHRHSLCEDQKNGGYWWRTAPLSFRMLILAHSLYYVNNYSEKTQCFSITVDSSVHPRTAPWLGLWLRECGKTVLCVGTSCFTCHDGDCPITKLYSWLISTPIGV